MLKRLSHPRPFYWLCLTEIWERFSFYATRSLLVLYLTKVLLFTNEKAYAVFAAFAALLYLTPVIGGYFADRLLGTKYSVVLGGTLSAMGYFFLSLPDEHFLYFGLALIITGNGFFIPNIANAVGHLYESKDSRRESAFSLFYAAINIGALVPPLFVAQIIHHVSWHAVFFCSSISMLIGTSLFFFSAPKLPYFVEAPHPFTSDHRLLQYFLLLVGIILSLGILVYLLNYPRIANFTLFTISAGFILFSLKKSFQFSTLERNRLLICLLLTAFSVLFWVLSEQAAMSLTIFTEYNVQRHVANWVIPTVMFQALNPLTIILLGPVIAKLWMILEKHQCNPSIPAKFALGTIFIGLGFIILPLGIFYSKTFQLNFAWVILSYVLQSTGELLISPVGLSMITELSPRKIMGLMMGTWYFATAVANSLAGIVASFTTLPKNINLPELTSPVFSHVFGTLGLIAIIAGIIALFFVPTLKRRMQS